jgi:outer membrane murein-binding lipoprotein Lpp
MRSFVPVLSAVLLAAACSSCGLADGASDSTIGQAGSDVPQTLSAAVAAAQANADRFSSGDFAGVWERMSREVRDEITQEDFVTFYETCKKTGPKIRVAGVRLDAGDAAIVRMQVGGTDQSRIILFENGNWVMKPTPGFAAHLGEPVEQIVAEERSAGLCSN